jgi:hypothetical protein
MARWAEDRPYPATKLSGNVQTPEPLRGKKHPKQPFSYRHLGLSPSISHRKISGLSFPAEETDILQKGIRLKCSDAKGSSGFNILTNVQNRNLIWTARQEKYQLLLQVNAPKANWSVVSEKTVPDQFGGASKPSALEDFLQEIGKRRPPNEHTMSSARRKSKDVLDVCLL